MKRKILFVVMPVLLFACISTLASCSCSIQTSQETNSSSSDDPVSSEIKDDNYYKITFKDYDGTVLQTSSVKEGETPTYNKANPTRDNDDNYSYTFSDWSPAISEVNADAIYTATYTSTIRQYNLTLSKNIDNAGTVNVTGTGTYHFNDSLTIKAETNPGYTFDGWYDGEEQLSNELSYTFNMPAANKSYEARWTANTNTAYQVIHYLQNIGNNDYTRHETDNLTGTTDTLTNAVAKTYPGFTSPTSVKQVNIKGDGSTVVELYYTRNEYTVSFVDDDGTQINNTKYDYGTSADAIVRPADPTKSADNKYTYTFSGWSPSISEVNADAIYTATYTSTIRQYTVTFVDENGTQINNTKYDYGTSVDDMDIPADPTKSSGNNNYTYTFSGWSPALANVTEDVTYRAKYNIYFGTYPQTKVDATDENGLKSIKFNSSGWTSYNYYVNGTQSNYMYYKDVDTNNDGIKDYRGVYFTQYRPYTSSMESSANKSVQNNNGYKTNTIYWFRYDPIEWKILKEENGKALILANLVLDSQEYYPGGVGPEFDHNGGTGYINNYKLSEIRKFINEDFYNTAFNNLQKTLIQTTTVDNSVSSTGHDPNSYACGDTQDKMFLLSYSEANDSNYGFTDDSSRTVQGSDYAKGQGFSVDTNNNGPWWLRSPSRFSGGYFVYCVYWDGDFSETDTNESYRGVRPACWINLQ